MQNKSITILFQNIRSILPNDQQLKKIEENIGYKFIDLLFYLPNRVIQHQICNNWEDLEDQKKVILKLFIQKHYNPFRIRNAPYKIKTTFCEKTIFLVFFTKKTGYLKRIFPENTEVVVSGKLDIYAKKYQVTHPNIIDAIINFDKNKLLVKPIYRQKKGLKSDKIKQSIETIFKKIPDISEWNKNLFDNYKNVPNWKKALESLHFPINESIQKEKSIALMRLAYDELLASQLSLILVRNSFNKKLGNKYFSSNQLYLNKLINSLPFQLTEEQKIILNQVIKDLLKKQRMNRLIHGDVGTGKTILALLAAYYVIKSKYQVAILAPTELLAKQHYKLATLLLKNFNISCFLLVSSSEKKEVILEKISEGEADLVIGTHSLIQERVKFKNLSFVIIDEQHRFGVEQRLKMREKGKNVDMLLLSATPIPRTLMLAALGDIDVSIMKQRPNKSEIKTIIKSENNLLEVISYVKEEIHRGKKIFWVCPMIDQEEELKKSNVIHRYNSLKNKFKDIAILHGKMSSDEKNAIIENFRVGFIKILITTVVIEVGIDIPDANIIIIEQSETFGLAQIHQLRGRVGRGKENGTCILLFKKNLTESAYERLLVMKSTNDGFIIAEKDLEMRGGGEVLGVKQYGYENFIFFDIIHHNSLVKIANKEANYILHKDPTLISPRGILLRNLLYIFKKDRVLDLISAG